MDKLQAHAALEMAQDAAKQLDGPDGNTWLDKLDGNFDVFEAALGWFVENDPDQGLIMAAALHIFWMERGHLSSGRQWLKRLLDIPETREAGRDRVAALNAAGRLAFRQGDQEEAASREEEALIVARSIGDRFGEAWALALLARVSLRDHDYRLVRERARMSRDIFHDIGDRKSEWSPLHVLAYVALMENELDKARHLFEASIELAQETSHETEVTGELQNLGVIEVRVGNYDRAMEHFRAALEPGIEREDRYLLPYIFLGIAAVHAHKGDVERAARLLGMTDAMLKESGMVLDPGDQPDYDETVKLAKTGLGDANYETANAAGAAMAFEEAATFARESAAS